MLSDFIRQGMSSLNINIDQKTIDAIEYFLMQYELRGTHPLALNTPLLGVYTISFIESDRNHFFNIFGVHEKDIDKIIALVPTIGSEWKVLGDAFNILSIWILHLAYTQIRDQHIREQFMINVAKFLHYRFFSSLVHHSFPHGANHAVMLATINGLSKKFDITIYGTWKLTIEARCKDLISSNSIHHKVFEKANDDKTYTYVITDVQTRMRDKVKNIVNEYKIVKSNGGAIDSKSSTIELDGEKMLRDKVNSIDTIISNLRTDILSSRVWINNTTVEFVVRKFTSISTDMLKSALLIMSETASVQLDSKEFDKIEVVDDRSELYIGMGALIRNFIMQSYRYIIKNHINPANKAQVFLKLLNAYSASRTSDVELIKIKDSISYFVDTIDLTRRPTTVSSLRIALLMYILVRGFQYT